MNEPHDMSTELWLEDANVAIQAIRRAGAHNLLLVPGNAWTGGHSWTHDWYGTPNAEVMLGIADSLDNYAYEIHQYLDSDYSGTSPECITAAEASEKLIDFTNWAKENGKRAFLGLDNSPLINSLLISKVTTKKNTAINASLIQCKTVRFNPKFFVPNNICVFKILK